MQRRFHRPSNVSIATGVSFFTSLYFYLPVMTLYLLQHGLNLFQVSAMNGMILASQFAAEVPTGILADRWGRKAAWVLAIFLQLLGEVWFFFARAYWEYLLIAVIAGVGFAFSSGAVDALIYDTLPAAERPLGMKKALGKISAAGRIGNLIAFMSSGVILARLTPLRFSIAIALTAACVGVGALLTLLALEPKNSHVTARITARRNSSLDILKSGLRILRSNPRLRRIVLLMILSEPFSFYLLIFNQLYFVRAGVGSAWLGPVLAIGSLLAAFSERFAYAIETRFGMRRTILAGTLLPGVFYLCMAPVRQPAVAILSLLCLYMTIYATRPLLRSYVNQHIESEIRATALSVIQLLSSIYSAGMGLVLGLIAGQSLTVLFVFMGGVILVASLLFRIDERHVENTGDLFKNPMDGF